MEQIASIVSELENIVSQLSNEDKKRILTENKGLKHILYGLPNYFHPISYEINLFEKKFDTKLSEELKKGLEIVGSKGYSFLDLFNHNISSYYPVESFFSEDFLIKLIQNGISKSEIEEGYYDKESKTFNSKRIEEIYTSSNEKENLLIDYISFDECCGGRSLLILNGPDENMITYDNHRSYKEFVYENDTYEYETYLYNSKTKTIFDMIYNEINQIVISLKNRNTISA
ncbi:hypothetical protein [uncultured Tenacibaculum sp.]|uniref:hypothetical protein n=1 Tax=uncultured Tenacibaculum sp. TaxID=174713 RepID=UPI0026058782|nr:hypothetical protein [uncultured Tenacibaculum sp.]